MLRIFKIFSIILSIIFAQSSFASPCANSLKNLNAQYTPQKGEGKVLNDLSQFCQRAFIDELEYGNILTYFAMLKNIDALTADEWRIVQAVAPLTSFADELLENNVLVPDLTKDSAQEQLDFDPALGRFKAIVTKSSYLMPNVYSKDITPELMVSKQYQESCQPGFPDKTAVLPIDQSQYPATFRISKEIFRVFLMSLKITVQMKASEVKDPKILKNLATLDENVSISKAILLERTKSDISHTDGSKVVKSLQIYRDVQGGMLVQNYTVVLNDQLPGGLSSVATYFGSKNASAEASETANRTRAYFSNRFSHRLKSRKK